MKRFLLMALFVVVSALSGSGAQAQTGLNRFDDWLFRAPAGWQKRQIAGSLALSSPDGRAAILLTPGEKLNGDLREWFDAKIERLHRSVTVVRASPVQSQKNKSGYTVLAQSVVVESRSGATSFQFYMAGNPSGRAEFASYVAGDAASFVKYNSVVMQFFEGADFVHLEPQLAAKATVIAPSASGTGTTTANNVGSYQAASGGKLFTVAQLSAVVELAKRRAGGDYRAKKAAASQALKALGVVYVQGRARRNLFLQYAGDLGTCKESIECDFSGADFDDRKANEKVVIVRGRLTGYDGTWIQMVDCQVVPSAAGLKKSTQSELPGIEDAEWLTLPGKGLKAAQIEGVYLKADSGIGVGGYATVEYNPYLFLKDGWVYDDPNEAPSTFNAPISKRLESKSWGQWKRANGKVTIRWQNSNGLTVYESSDFQRVAPAKLGTKLVGHYQSLSGGGNTAFGGSTVIAAWKDFYFNSGGKFSRESGAGGSGGGDYSGDGPNMAFHSNSGASGGTYSIQGFNIEFRYANGKIRRAFYCAFPSKDNKNDVVVIGGSTFIKK